MSAAPQSRHSFSFPSGLVLGVLLAILLPAVLSAQAVISVADTSGWTPWTTASNQIVMTDPTNDQQTGQNTDDFVGNATTFGFQQKAGTIGGTDYMLFRARFSQFTAVNKFGSNGGNLGLGIDADNNGSIDLITMLSSTGGATPTVTIRFGTPGAGANTGPSTTTWTFPTQTSISPTYYNTTTPNPTTATYYLQDATLVDGVNFASGSSGSGNDAWLTFGVSFAQLQDAIRTYSKPFTGSSTFTFSYDTRMSFIAYTSTQDNALNQDLYGTSGNTSSSSSWSTLGSITPPIGANGAVPEPATYVQVGVFLLTGALLLHRRRNRRLAQV